MEELRWQAKYGVLLFWYFRFSIFLHTFYPLSNDLTQGTLVGLQFLLAMLFFLSINPGFNPVKNFEIIRILRSYSTYGAMCPWRDFASICYLKTSPIGVEVIFLQLPFYNHHILICQTGDLRKIERRLKNWSSLYSKKAKYRGFVLIKVYGNWDLPKEMSEVAPAGFSIGSTSKKLLKYF